VSLFPALNQLFGKIIRDFLDFVYRKIKAILEWILRKIIIRIITNLHEWGIFEVLAYVSVFEMIYEGSKLDKRDNLGLMLAVTGIALAIPVWAYSKSLHTRTLKSTQADEEKILNLAATWAVFYTIPAAIVL
jgi:hypothetical protein